METIDTSFEKLSGCRLEKEEIRNWRTRMDNAVIDVQKLPSKPSLAFAVILIVLGLLAITVPRATSIGVVRVLAWLVIFDGLAQLVYAAKSNVRGRTGWKLWVAILYLGGGIYLLARPLLGLAGLTILLAMFFFTEGVIYMAAHIVTRGMSGSAWLLFHALVTFIVALMILRGWPLSSFRVVGTLVGISMVLTGATQLVTALEVRKPVAAHGH